MGSMIIEWNVKITDLVSIVISILGFIITATGAFLALAQWKKGNLYKRTEFVQQLILKVRDDDDIATIMASLDWNEGMIYDGRFHVNPNCEYNKLTGLSDDELFRKVDKTLSHFSYICYLWEKGCLKSSDMYHFEYELRRIADNKHTANYLYSLHHWSKSIDSNCSFAYLISYLLKKEFFCKRKILLGSEK